MYIFPSINIHTELVFIQFSFFFGKIIFTKKPPNSTVLHFDSKHFLNIPFRSLLISFLFLMCWLFIMNMALRRQAWGILKHVSIFDFISAELNEFDNFLLTSSRYGRLYWPQYINPKDSQSCGLSSSSFLVELNVLLVAICTSCLVWVSLSN